MIEHYTAESLDEVRAYSAWDLATLAECAHPDACDSAGALMLLYVQAAVIEHAESYGLVCDDTRYEISDGTPNVYTGARWREFVDLGAWQEDLSELCATDTQGELTDLAGIALYVIADRLVSALVEVLIELTPGCDDCADDDCPIHPEEEN